MILVALVAVGEILVWGIVGVIYLALRTQDPFGPAYTSAELAQHEQLVRITGAMLILTIAGFLIFFLRSRSFGLPVLAAVQVVNVVVLIGLRNQHGYDVLDMNVGLIALPVIGLLLLALLWRYSPPPLKQPKAGA
jgi:hypothetical protein